MASVRPDPGVGAPPASVPALSAVLAVAFVRAWVPLAILLFLAIPTLLLAWWFRSRLIRRKGRFSGGKSGSGPWTLLCVGLPQTGKTALLQSVGSCAPPWFDHAEFLPAPTLAPPFQPHEHVPELAMTTTPPAVCGRSLGVWFGSPLTLLLHLSWSDLGATAIAFSLPLWATIGFPTPDQVYSATPKPTVATISPRPVLLELHGTPDHRPTSVCLLDLPGHMAGSDTQLAETLEQADALLFVVDSAAFLDDKDPTVLLLLRLLTQQAQATTEPRPLAIAFHKADLVPNSAAQLLTVLEEAYAAAAAHRHSGAVPSPLDATLSSEPAPASSFRPQARAPASLRAAGHDPAATFQTASPLKSQPHHRSDSLQEWICAQATGHTAPKRVLSASPSRPKQD